MGKNLIQQRRGRGSIFKSPGFRFKGAISFSGIGNETLDGKIIDLINCPGHSAPLMKVQLGKKSILIPAPENVKVGDSISAGPDAKPGNGSIVSLRNIPEGMFVYNIEKTPGDGGKIIRTSGSSARVMSKTEKKVTILLPSKKELIVSAECKAVIGVIAGSGRLDKPFVKAGKKFHAKNARNKLYPIVCGVSMNSVAHPYGGSSSHAKGRPNVTSRNAPPGRKVGKIGASRTGRKKR